VGVDLVVAGNTIALHQEPLVLRVEHGGLMVIAREGLDGLSESQA
jgi:hypothetical protein